MQPRADRNMAVDPDSLRNREVTVVPSGSSEHAEHPTAPEDDEVFVPQPQPATETIPTGAADDPEPLDPHA